MKPISRAPLFAVAMTLFAGCAPQTQSSPTTAPPTAAPQKIAAQKPALSLQQMRRGFQTKLVRREKENQAVAAPPAGLFRTVSYDSPIGKMAAYVGVDPRDGKKHPAIVWIFGGFGNSIDNSAWQSAPASNDQSASAFRQAGIVMMYPSLRGGNKNPGWKEGFYGEVDDVLAAAKFLATQPHVDPKRIYLGGHSTGGTLALLCAEMPNPFRATFAFGPVSSAKQYGAEYLPYDITNKRENILRAPISWLSSIAHPTFVFEGTEQPGNYDMLQLMQKYSSNAQIRFLPVPRATHFSILAPTTKLIAQKIVKDNGAQTDIAFSQAELDGLMR